MRTLIAIPLFLFIDIIQTVVISRLPLLHGFADLTLLVLVAYALQEQAKNVWEWTFIAGVMMSFISALPYFSPLIIYIIIIFLVRMLQRRIWQTPLLAMITATLLGTIIQHGMSILILQFLNVPISWQDSFSLITLPSIMMNLFFSLPVHALIVDMTDWLHPIEVRA